jgi:hypothetical protein
LASEVCERCRRLITDALQLRTQPGQRQGASRDQGQRPVGGGALSRGRSRLRPNVSQRSTQSRPSRRTLTVCTSIPGVSARTRRTSGGSTAAAGGMSIEGGNPARTENNLQAVALDTRLRSLWQHHPRFILVPHNPSFFKKITCGLAALEGLVSQLTPKPPHPSH